MLRAPPFLKKGGCGAPPFFSHPLFIFAPPFLNSCIRPCAPSCFFDWFHYCFPCLTGRSSYDVSRANIPSSGHHNVVFQQHNNGQNGLELSKQQIDNGHSADSVINNVASSVCNGNTSLSNGHTSLSNGHMSVSNGQALPSNRHIISESNNEHSNHHRPLNGHVKGEKQMYGSTIVSESSKGQNRYVKILQYICPLSL